MIKKDTITSRNASDSNLLSLQKRTLSKTPALEIFKKKGIRKAKINHVKHTPVKKLKRQHLVKLVHRVSTRAITREDRWQRSVKEAEAEHSKL